MNLQAAFYTAGVGNESQFREPVHEKAYSGTSGADHFCQGFLTDLRNHGLGHPFFAKMSEHKKDTRESLFAGIKQLVDQILFVADVAREQILHEHIGESVFPMKRVTHRLLLDPQELAVCHCRRGSHTESLACQRPFTEKISLAQYADGGFLAGLGYDSEPHFALLDIENSVSRIPLCEDPLLLGNSQALPALANGREEGAGIEPSVLLRCRNRTHEQLF